MPLSLTIPKKLNYPPTMDYALLRREGLRHIERLGSAVWTDFNSHDPGVTILEVLCYALTDLGYRMQLPDSDLFTPTGNRKAFFTAAEILPNAPVTALDFRKILIDTEGVKNAWLERCSDAPVSFMLAIPVDKDGKGIEIEIKLPELKAYPELDLVLSDTKILFSLNAVKPTVEDPYIIPKQKIADVGRYLEVIYKLKKEKKTQSAIAMQESLVNDISRTFMDANLKDENIKKLWLLHYVEDHLSEVKNWLISHSNSDNRKGILTQLNTIFKYLNFIRINKNTKDKIIKAELEATKSQLKLELTKVLAVIKVDKDFEKYLFVKPLWRQLVCSNGFSLKKQGDTNAYSLFSTRGVYKIYIQLEEDYAEMASDIRAKALQCLHRNRALSEDFDPEIAVIDKVFIGINATIEILPDADLPKVYADIAYAIEEFLSPTVKMYSLQEMLDKYATFELTDKSFETLVDAELPSEVIKNLEILRGVKFISKTAWTAAALKAIGATAMADYAGLIFNETEKTYESHDVFQGPLLTHGFIDNTELASATWRRTVYKSDLFQVISNIEGVVRVQNLKIYDCKELRAAKKTRTEVADKWCLSFDCLCQPTLDIDPECSELSFTNGGRPIAPNNNTYFEVLDRLEELRNHNTKIDRTKDRDLPIPQGIKRDDLAEYTSIQEEFPNTYHVGSEGIVSTETALRKAQVKQIKGFLMFFDQILTNYLRYMGQIRDILTIDDSDDKLHLYQPLYDAPKVQELFTAFDPQTEKWEDFIKNPKNKYVQALQNLTDGSDIAQKIRKNQLLDHLLARFGEQFTDYVLDFFKIDRQLQDDDVNIAATGEGTEGVKDWLDDKRLFLKNLPNLGSLRGRAFNYRLEPDEENRHFWVSDNIEGFKRRVFAQLGMKNEQRRTISNEPTFYVDLRLEIIKKTKFYRFGIKAHEGAPSFWLLSTALYSQYDTVEKEADAFFSISAIAENYRIVLENSFFYVGYWLTGNKAEDALLISAPIKENFRADRLLEEIKQHIEQRAQNDNFHVVEHILLRPTDKYYEPLKPMVCHEDLSRLDPYSFWITIVVPKWIERFLDPKQYDFFKQLVRTEMPTHVAIRFKRLNQAKMLRFEDKYFKWLQIKTDEYMEAADLREATNQLVKILNDF